MALDGKKKLQSDIGPYSTVAKDNDFAKKDKNNSKEHGALAKIGNMLFCSRRGWKTSVDLQKQCGLLQLRQFWQKRSLQQSHFRHHKTH